MQQCPVCGQSYGLTHSCPGAIPPAEAAEWTPPSGFAAGYYFRQAFAIARFEDAAIVHASRDSNALLYGATIWFVGALLSVATGTARSLSQGAPPNWFAVALGAPVVIVFTATLTLTQYGICHLLARWWFGAAGSYLGVLRAMLLGSVVVWVVVLPYVGTLLAGLWSTAVLMRVFEEVDGIGRMKAFALAFGVGVLFWIPTFLLFAPKR